MADCNLAANFKELNPAWADKPYGYGVSCKEVDLTQELNMLREGSE